MVLYQFYQGIAMVKYLIHSSVIVRVVKLPPAIAIAPATTPSQFAPNLFRPRGNYIDSLILH